MPEALFCLALLVIALGIHHYNKKVQKNLDDDE